MLGGLYSKRFMRMASSEHFGVRRVDEYYVIVMNKGVNKLQALGI
jgi:hypothetical protein